MAKKRQEENLGPHPILMWGLVIVLLVALFFLINSSLFNVSQITVEGNIKVSHEEIIKLSGIDANTNIFHIDEVQAKQNIEQNGYLVVENIKRVFPSEVKIKVRERIAVAQIGTVNGYYVIDKEGIALNLIPVKEDGLVTVSNLQIAEPSYAQKIVGETQEKTDGMFYMLEAIELYKLQGKVTGIDLSNPQKIMLTYQGDIKVQIGSGLTAKDRLKYLEATVNGVKDKLKDGSVINMESAGGYYIS